MKTYKVKLTIRRMGRSCNSCKQDYEGEFSAESAEQAVSKAKRQSGANPDYHQFSISLIKEL